MSGRILRTMLLVALLPLGLWGWRVLHPSQEHLIQKALTGLARTACVPPNEAQLSKLANAQKVASFFATDAEISVDLPGRFSQTINGRDEIQEKALGARAVLNGFTVEFVDVGVTVAPDGQSAVARLTAKANFPGDNVPQVEELKIDFKRVEGDWLIQHAENVKTLH
jgi:hypothetical protein